MAVTVDVLGLFVEGATDGWVVLLGDPSDGGRLLPIFIGTAEAHSIALGVSGASASRPAGSASASAPHDLTIDLIQTLEGAIDRVTITELVEDTFLAQLSVDTIAGLRTVPTRPSDGIALAVRTGAPVLVEESVLDIAGVVIDRQPGEPLDEQQIETIVTAFRDFLAETDPKDFEA